MYGFTNDIDIAIDKLYRYSPDSAERMTGRLNPEGESYFGELVSDGTKVVIKTYDWSYNKFFNLGKELSVTTYNLNPKDKESGTPYFIKGLLEILSIISIELLLEDSMSDDDAIIEIGIMIEKLSEHLEVSVSMLNIDVKFLNAFKEHLEDEFK